MREVARGGGRFGLRATAGGGCAASSCPGGDRTPSAAQEMLRVRDSSTTAPFPVEASANSVAYGPRIKALMVYLMEYQLLPYERTPASCFVTSSGGAPWCRGWGRSTRP